MRRKDGNLTEKEIQVLQYIVLGCGEATGYRIAIFFGMGKSTSFRILKSLQNRGFVNYSLKSKYGTVLLRKVYHFVRVNQ